MQSFKWQFQMAILSAREDHELFENCYRGGKKIETGNT